MSHIAYVTAAYLISALVLVGLAGRIWLDQRTQKRNLAELEARGIRRRSAQAEGSE